jgi:hypothetical protein
MLYLANPSTAGVRNAMAAGLLGAIMSPRQGNQLPDAALFAIDNNCGPGKNGQPGTAYPGDEHYLGLLQDLAEAEDADACDPDSRWCLFATAPDVLGDAVATLQRSARMLDLIRYAGFPAALVAQDGLEHLPVPWDDFDALFIGGSTAWKLGTAARTLAAEARRRGKWVHMGRVNSLRRLRYADAIGCDSADGTYLTYAPDANLPRLLGWLRQIHGQGALWAAA